MKNDTRTQAPNPRTAPFGSLTEYYDHAAGQLRRGRVPMFMMHDIDQLVDQLPAAQLEQDMMTMSIRTSAKMMMRAQVVLELALQKYDHYYGDRARDLMSPLPAYLKDALDRTERLQRHTMEIIGAKAKIGRICAMTEATKNRTARQTTAAEKDPPQAESSQPNTTVEQSICARRQDTNGNGNRSLNSLATMLKTSPETDRFSIGDSAGASDGASV